MFAIMSIRKIIVSGGWGYYNLGDDAICSATTKILERKYPKAKIVVLTYNVEETKEILNSSENIEVYESLHKSMFNDYDISDSARIIFDINRQLLNKLKRRGIIRDNSSLYVKRCLSNIDVFLKEYEEQISNFYHLCSDSDIYIMSGGGYINNWNSSLVSKFIEVAIAKKMGLKCFLIGQTIGPFFKRRNEQLTKKMLDIVDGAFFRDIESINDAKKWGANITRNEVVPDLALYEKYNFNTENYILIIPFNESLLDNFATLSINLKKIIFQKKTRIVITVSQLWGHELYVASALFVSLKNSAIDVSLVIPNNLFELQEIIGKAKLVLSQNLHGLILAYRSGVPIICMNNKRKFVSFMKSISNEGAIILPEDLTDENLYKLSSSQIDNKRDMKDFHNYIYDIIEVFLPNESI